LWLQLPAELSAHQTGLVIQSFTSKSSSSSSSASSSAALNQSEFKIPDAAIHQHLKPFHRAIIELLQPIILAAPHRFVPSLLKLWQDILIAGSDRISSSLVGNSPASSATMLLPLNAQIQVVPNEGHLRLLQLLQTVAPLSPDMLLHPILASLLYGVSQKKFYIFIFD
jgi:hypothetical protein